MASDAKSKDMKAGLMYLVPRFLSSILPLAILPFLTRALTTADFGLIALGSVYGTLVAGLVNMGFAVVYERNYFKYKTDSAKTRNLLYTCLIYLLASGALVVFGSEFLSGMVDKYFFLAETPKGLLFYCALASVLQNVIALQYNYLRNAEHPKAFAGFSTLEALLGFGLKILMIITLGMGAPGFMAAQSLAFGIVFGLASIYIFGREIPRFEFALLRESIVMGYPLTFRVLVGMMASQFDKFILNYISDLGVVGIYSIGQRIAQAVFLFMTTIDYVMGPKVYSLMFKEDKAGIPKQIGDYILPFLYITTGIGLGVSLFSEEVLLLFTTQDYVGAVPVAIILSMYYAILFFGKVNSRQMMYAEKSYLSFVLSIVSLVLNAAFMYPMVKLWGVAGAAWGTLASGLIYSFICFKLGQSCFAIQWRLRESFLVLGVFFASAIMQIALLGEPYSARLAAKLMGLFAFFMLGHRLSILNFRKSILFSSKDHLIPTERFSLRTLEEKDATPRYLSWLQNKDVSRFIATAHESNDLKKLAQYIREKKNQSDALFFGIFEKESKEHIGNIKYEPIDLKNKEAIMGILIGESSWHGKGVAGEVIKASAGYLKEKKGIQRIVLGVDFDNEPAIKAYEKMGFVKQNKPKDSKSFFMELGL